MKMGVSFKVARVGTRYRPRYNSPPPPPPPSGEGVAAAGEAGAEAPPPRNGDREVSLLGSRGGSVDYSVSSNSENNHIAGHEASFSVNLYPAGFSIGKPTEGMLLPLLEEVPMSLHPYDRASNALFTAIEYGWLPGEILDDIPCKYLNGNVICEVSCRNAGRIWDYRSFMSKSGNDVSNGDDFPKVQKVSLRTGMENVIKDISSISNDSWTYNDLLQFEARIIHALQPVLFLGPKPLIDGPYGTPISKQLDLGICKQKLTRKKLDIAEINSDLIDTSNAKGMLIDRPAENLKSQSCVAFGDGAVNFAENVTSKNICDEQKKNAKRDVLDNTSPTALQPYYSSDVNCLVSVPINLVALSNVTSTSNHQVEKSPVEPSTNLSQKRTRCMMETTTQVALKRPKQEPVDFDVCQTVTEQRNILFQQKSQANIIHLQKQQAAYKTEHLKLYDQKYPPQNSKRINGIPKIPARTPSQLCQTSVQCSVRKSFDKAVSKQQAEVEKVDHALDTTCQKFNQQRSLASNGSLPQMQGTSSGPPVAKYPKKHCSAPKRKLSHSPSVLVGNSAHSQQFKLGENQEASSQASCSTCLADASYELQKDAGVLPAASAGTVVNLSSRNSLNQLSVQKRKPEVLDRNSSESKTRTGLLLQEAISGINTPPSSKKRLSGISTMQPLLEPNNDPSIIERFSKIEMLTQRHRLKNSKKGHGISYGRKLLSNCPTPLMQHLLLEDNEGSLPHMGKNSMSKYVTGGSRNKQKIRMLTFLRATYMFKANFGPILVIDSCIKLVLSESDELQDDRVGAEIIYGDDECRFHIAFLPTAHRADIFADQFTSLMIHDGYKLVNDQLQPTQASSMDPSSNFVQTNFQGVVEPPRITHISSQSLNKVSASVNLSSSTPLWFPTVNLLSQSRKPPNNLTRPQMVDLRSLQHQQSQDQSSLLLAGTNVSVKSISMGSHMSSKLTNLQNLCMPKSMQQQQQHEQLSILHNKTDNVHDLGGHVSSLKMSQINDNFGQILSSSHSFLRLPNSGMSKAEESQLVKPMQANRSVVEVVNDIPMQDKDRFIFPEILPMSANNYEQGQCQQIRQQRRQLGFPQQHTLQLASQPHLTSGMSPNQLSVASTSRSSDSGNVCNSQLSSQTIRCGGSITSSHRELQGVFKGNIDGNFGHLEQ